jgi:hypothetical protein
MQREEPIRLRAADSDRDKAADALRRAHVEGRIETAELEERLEACYAAKTYDELDALLADLPRPRQREPRQPRRPRVLRAIPVAALIVVLVFAWHAAWLLWWVAIFAFFRMRRHGCRRYPRPI